MGSEYPDKDIEFVRAIAEGDLVSLHTRRIWPDNEEYVTMDFFPVLMTMGRLLNTGIPFKKFQMNLNVAIQYINTIYLKKKSGTNSYHPLCKTG